MCQVMFEDYGFDGVYVAIQAVLTLYAQGQGLLGSRSAVVLNFVRSHHWCGRGFR